MVEMTVIQCQLFVSRETFPETQDVMHFILINNGNKQWKLVSMTSHCQSYQSNPKSAVQKYLARRIW